VSQNSSKRRRSLRLDNEDGAGGETSSTTRLCHLYGERTVYRVAMTTFLCVTVRIRRRHRCRSLDNHIYGSSKACPIFISIIVWSELRIVRGPNEGTVYLFQRSENGWSRKTMRYTNRGLMDSFLATRSQTECVVRSVPTLNEHYRDHTRCDMRRPCHAYTH